jgi:hypothetical protein
LRRALLPLVLLVILLGLIQVERWLSGQHYILSAQPGAVLYTATFEDYLDDWAQYEGRLQAAVVNESLRISNGQTNIGAFSETRQHFADFDLLLEARAVSGPLDNAFGVIFRLQTGASRSPADNSYYLFLISSDGYYQVQRMVAGESREISTWIPTQLINQGVGTVAASNWLRVVAQGDQFRFFINGIHVPLCIPDNPDSLSTYDEARGECLGGQMQDTLVDSSIASGQLGAVVLTLSEPNVVVDFDNVLVLAPAAVGEHTE